MKVPRKNRGGNRGNVGNADNPDSKDTCINMPISIHSSILNPHNYSAYRSEPDQTPTGYEPGFDALAQKIQHLQWSTSRFSNNGSRCTSSPIDHAKCTNCTGCTSHHQWPGFSIQSFDRPTHAFQNWLSNLQISQLSCLVSHGQDILHSARPLQHRQWLRTQSSRAHHPSKSIWWNHSTRWWIYSSQWSYTYMGRWTTTCLGLEPSSCIGVWIHHEIPHRWCCRIL